MTVFLDIHDLEKRIDGFHLGPIDFKGESGKVIGLVGNNASGKSTLLKLIMDLAKPEMGNVVLFDKFVYGHDESWKVDVSYLPQDQVGYDPFTGAELKQFIARLYPNWDDILFKQMVEDFEIPLDRKYNKLSQGAQKKLCLALTLPRNTRLLILDEPTNFIDIPSKKKLIGFLLDWIKQEERLIVMASHQIEDLKELVDELVVLKDGTQIGAYDKETLLEKYKAYVLDKPLDETHTISGIIKQEGTRVVSDQPTLTEVELTQAQISFASQEPLLLDEILTLLLR